MENKKRDGFATGIGALLAMVGSAIGVGNVISFPAKIAGNGGGAFILIYIFFLIVLGVPLLTSEFIVGRYARANTFDSYAKVGGHKNWGILGVIAPFAGLVTMAYYTVLASWIWGYGFNALSGKLEGLDAEAAGAFNGTFLSSWAPFITVIIFTTLIGIVLTFGIKKGLEKVVKVLMPLFLIIVVVIIIRGVMQPAAGDAAKIMLEPRFGDVKFESVLSALGLAFFKLSLSLGTMIVYGSYTTKSTRVLPTASKIAVIDLLASIAIGFAIFAGLGGPDGGFKLLFVSIPSLFSSNVGILTNIVMSLFFLLTGIVAFTASLSIVEPIVNVINEKTKASRTASVWIVVGVIMVGAAIISLSTGAVESLGFLQKTDLGAIQSGVGTDPGIIDTLDTIIQKILMPTLGIFLAILVTYRMNKKDHYNEFTNDGEFGGGMLYKIHRTLLYVAPVLLIIVLINGVVLPFFKN